MTRPAWLTPRLVLSAVMGAAAVVLLTVTRDQTFFADEWAFFANYRGVDPDVLLAPSSGNLLLAPTLLYKTMIAVFGAENYVPFRLLWVGLVLLSAGLFYRLTRPMIGDWTALVPTTLLLFLGAAFEVFAGPLGITVLLTVSCGLGAILCIDRDDGPGDLAACALLLVALASYTPALAFAIGAAVEIVVRRGWHRRRDLWIVALPLLLYAAWRIWAIKFHQTDVGIDNLLSLPSSIASSVAAVCAAITGTFRDPGNPGLSFDPAPGRTIAVVLALAIGVRFLLRRSWPLDRRVWVFIAMPLVFWALIGANLGPLRAPESSRYQYTGAVMVLLLVAQLGAGQRISRTGGLVLAGVLVFCLAGNLGNLKDGAGFLRENSDQNRAQLAALQLVAPAANPDQTVEPLVGGPSPREDLLIFTHAYLSAAADLGSPAYPIEEVPGRPDHVRQRADLQMVRALGLQPVPPVLVPADVVPGGLPLPQGSESATVAPRRGCLEITPQLADAKAAFALLPGGFSVVASAEQSPPKLRLRRFGEAFVAEIPSPPPGTRSVVRIPPDAAPIPWHLEVTTSVPTRICAP